MWFTSMFHAQPLSQESNRANKGQRDARLLRWSLAESANFLAPIHCLQVHNPIGTMQHLHETHSCRRPKFGVGCCGSHDLHSRASIRGTKYGAPGGTGSGGHCGGSVDAFSFSLVVVPKAQVLINHLVGR